MAHKFRKAPSNERPLKPAITFNNHTHHLAENHAARIGAWMNQAAPPHAGHILIAAIAEERSNPHLSLLLSRNAAQMLPRREFLI